MGALSLPSTTLEGFVGKVIDNRFRVLDLLGQGGMGAVFRAHQISMNRDVALKVIQADLAEDPKVVQRFLREAIAASRLTNPHTITVFDFGQTPEGLVYIAMELLRGRSLARVLQDEGGPLPAGRAVRIVRQVLESLAEAHDAGVLHRDLKPENVFVVEGKRTRDFVKVLDFGVAKLQDPDAASLTTTGMVFGTPVYMSPEQAQAMPLDGRCDLYSTGVMLFELLSGKPPFDAPTPMALLVQKSYEKAPAIAHVNPGVRVPAALEAVVARLLEADPAKRPATAAEASRLLAEAIGDRGEDREADEAVPSATAGRAATEDVRSLPTVLVPGRVEGRTGADDRSGLKTTVKVRGKSRRGTAWIVAAAVLGAGLAALLAWAPWTPGPDASPESPAKAAAPTVPPAVAPAEVPVPAAAVPVPAPTGIPAPAAEAPAPAVSAPVPAGKGSAVPPAAARSAPAAPKRKTETRPAPSGGGDVEMLRMLKHRGSGGN